jgi:MFS family permease
VFVCRRRVEAGAFLFVASPLGMFLAGLVARVVTGALASSSSSSVAWRVVMLTGVAPAIVAFALRCCVREPERWIRATTITTTRYDGELDDAIASGGEVVVNNTTNRFSALFDRSNRVVTITNLVLSIVILLLLWPMTAFIPTLATGFAIRASTIENRTAMIERYGEIIYILQ